MTMTVSPIWVTTSAIDNPNRAPAAPMVRLPMRSVASRLNEAILMAGIRPNITPASTDAPKVKRMSLKWERNVLNARGVCGQESHEDAQAGKCRCQSNDAGGYPEHYAFDEDLLDEAKAGSA